jgi:xanthine dehydrogenase small subunit
LSDIGTRWRAAPPVVHEWLDLFASPPIRNRATLGGNLATASPIGDAAPLLLALDASVHIAGRNGQRTHPLASFFTGYRRTVLQRGEILTTIEIPQPLPGFVRFYKIAKRRLDDISTVAAGACAARGSRSAASRPRPCWLARPSRP